MLSPASVVQSLASDSTPPAPVSGVPHPHGVGPVARRTAALAARDGLFLHHREHRVELHASFTDDPAEAVPLEWADGRLLGPPHAHEALERLTGAFDPQAPALAAVAELSRGLVGFCWKPEASPLHLACTARLAWLLPRVIEHGLGHVGVARCAAHEVEPRGGCPSCERLSAVRPPDAHDEALVSDVLHFVDAELAAITRTRRTGVPQGPRLGTYDPVATSLAWAATHRARLASASFQRLGWMFVPDGGHVGTLDALEA
ncbi:MAG: hypothetical protein KC656_35825, partial [Myxococcales bacterium]|nr:hypothetical protein [Myxococcales bacterium]